MNRRDVAIADIARALADLNVADRAQRVAIFEKSIASVVNFAISEHEVAKFTGIRDDLAKIAAIQAASRKAV